MVASALTNVGVGNGERDLLGVHCFEMRTKRMHSNYLFLCRNVKFGLNFNTFEMIWGNGGGGKKACRGMPPWYQLCLEDSFTQLLCGY